MGAGGGGGGGVGVREERQQEMGRRGEGRDGRREKKRNGVAYTRKVGDTNLKEIGRGVRDR